jgi:hypothetical protein
VIILRDLADGGDGVRDGHQVVENYADAHYVVVCSFEGSTSYFFLTLLGRLTMVDRYWYNRYRYGEEYLQWWMNIDEFIDYLMF